MEVAEAYVDGASRGNPGPAGIGVVIVVDGRVEKVSEFIGNATNNEAEYRALIKALQLASSLEVKRIRVYSDSELLVKQVRGEYVVKNERLISLHERVMELIAGFEEFSIAHVGREHNRESDKLANEAIDKGLKKKAIRDV